MWTSKKKEASKRVSVFRCEPTESINQDQKLRTEVC